MTPFYGTSYGKPMPLLNNFTSFGGFSTMLSLQKLTSQREVSVRNLCVPDVIRALKLWIMCFYTVTGLLRLGSFPP
jgi:hypothetical protein